MLHEIRKISPYHPQANGLVKRFHGTLQEKLGQATIAKPQLHGITICRKSLWVIAIPLNIPRSAAPSDVLSTVLPIETGHELLEKLKLEK